MIKKYFLHKSSFVDKNVAIGNGTKIWHFCHISSGAKIGKDCTLGQNVFVGEKVKIGDNVKIQNNVSIYEGVELEDNVFCGPSVVFTNVKSPRSEYPAGKHFSKTLIKKGATVGANATIICGVTIGSYSFIGAGAVVTRNIKDYALVYGNPGREMGKVDKKGKRA